MKAQSSLRLFSPAAFHNISAVEEQKERKDCKKQTHEKSKPMIPHQTSEQDFSGADSAGKDGEELSGSKDTRDLAFCDANITYEKNAGSQQAPEITYEKNAGSQQALEITYEKDAGSQQAPPKSAVVP